MTMLAEMSGSTTPWGSETRLNAASVKVIVWATVKAVTTFIRFQNVVAAKTNALTNRRWS